KPVILSADGRELRLEKNVGARHRPLGDGRRDGRSYGGLEIVPALVRRIDSTKTRRKRCPRQVLRQLLLPCRPVEEARHRNTLHESPHAPRMPPASAFLCVFEEAAYTEPITSSYSPLNILNLLEISR